jgi:hypothetical protein
MGNNKQRGRNRPARSGNRISVYFLLLLKKILRFFILFIYFTQKKFISVFYTIKQLLKKISNSQIILFKKNPKI